VTILDNIAKYKREEITAARARVSERELEVRAAKLAFEDPPRGFLNALRSARANDRYGLIAEIKKASPSKGLIRADFEPAKLAAEYERGGATCLSVLTDSPSFQGAPEFLRLARGNASLPVLRKDFMFEPYQVTEARTWGADCILVIMAAVTDSEAQDLIDTANLWGMDSLVEVHDEAELDRALALGANFIGINNRDLKTFVTDLNVTLNLLPRIPRGVLVVAESGLSSPDDLACLAKAGVATFLIGESLMRETDVTAATQRLLANSYKRAQDRPSSDRIWAPKMFLDSVVKEAVQTVKRERPDLWGAFVKYQRLDEGYNDIAGYRRLDRELTTLLYRHYKDEMNSADLVQFVWQMRLAARREAGLVD
jgi:indole-3-glycerol phosphate synthase